MKPAERVRDEREMDEREEGRTWLECEVEDLVDSCDFFVWGCVQYDDEGA